MSIPFGPLPIDAYSAGLRNGIDDNGRVEIDVIHPDYKEEALLYEDQIWTAKCIERAAELKRSLTRPSWPLVGTSVFWVGLIVAAIVEVL